MDDWKQACDARRRARQADGDPDLPTAPRKHRGKVLFSPLGLSPGSLFSAIVHERPAHVFVVTSREGAGKLPEIVARAREHHADFQLRYVTVEDPFTGFSQGRRVARALAHEAGDENVVNLTGGTTALQDVVQEIAWRVGAREVAVVDRRDVVDQRKDPYALGELVSLTRESAAGTDEAVTLLEV